MNNPKQPPRGEYAGMSYEQASRKGMELIKAATQTGYWKFLPEHLAELRDIMKSASRVSA